MNPPPDIIAKAELLRDFHFIPGNTYNPDVVEKIHYAQALLDAEQKLAELRHLIVEARSFADDGTVSLRQRLNICQRDLASMISIFNRPL